MFAVRRNVARLYPSGLQLAKMSSQLGDLGSGAGRGGGGGGSIREAGGAFGKMEAAREEEYFYKKQKEQLDRLKNDQIHQAEFHHQQIKEHEEAIQRHQKFLNNLNKIGFNGLNPLSVVCEIQQRLRLKALQKQRDDLAIKHCRLTMKQRNFEVLITEMTRMIRRLDADLQKPIETEKQKSKLELETESESESLK